MNETVLYQLLDVSTIKRDCIHNFTKSVIYYFFIEKHFQELNACYLLGYDTLIFHQN